MSSGSPNWSGFTKMLTATTSHSARARSSSDVCPSCSAPMVGTSPTTRPGGAGPVQHGATGGDGLDDLHRDCSYTAAGWAGAVASAGWAGTWRPAAAAAASVWASRVARAAPAW